MSRKDAEEGSLELVTKQVTEMKKKIQLLGEHTYIVIVYDQLINNSFAMTRVWLILVSCSRGSAESSLRNVGQREEAKRRENQTAEGEHQAHVLGTGQANDRTPSRFRNLVFRFVIFIRSRLQMPKNVKICDKMASQKVNDEALESLDSKVIEARKKLDLLQHEINQVR